MRALALALLFACAGAEAAPASSTRTRALHAARAGFVRRLTEEAGKFQELSAQAHAHPLGKLLGWQRLSRPGQAVSFVNPEDHDTRRFQQLTMDRDGRLVFDGRQVAVTAELQLAGLRSLDDVSAMMSQRLVREARQVDPGVKGIGDAIGALAERARRDDEVSLAHAPWLGHVVRNGVNSPDAVLLLAMHQGLYGRDATVPLTRDGGITLRLSPQAAGGPASNQGSSHAPSLWLDDGGRPRAADAASLVRLGVSTRADLDRLIEDAMLSIAPEDY